MLPKWGGGLCEPYTYYNILCVCFNNEFVGEAYTRPCSSLEMNSTWGVLFAPDFTFYGQKILPEFFKVGLFGVKIAFSGISNASRSATCHLGVF